MPAVLRGAVAAACAREVVPACARQVVDAVQEAGFRADEVRLAGAQMGEVPADAVPYAVDGQVPAAAVLADGPLTALPLFHSTVQPAQAAIFAGWPRQRSSC